MPPPTDLDRFVAAQAPVYDRAVAELLAGDKQSHWMWFIFPQLAGLGRSQTARFFGLSGLAEVERYLVHPLLGPRLQECTRIMLDWAGKRTPLAILGPVDTMKFASSMTLFEAAAMGTQTDSSLFSDAIYRLCDKKRDTMTLDLLESGADSA